MATSASLPGIQSLGCGFNPFENALLKHKRRLWEFDFEGGDKPYVSSAAAGYYIFNGAKYSIPKGILFLDEFQEGTSAAEVSETRHEVEQKLAAEADVSGGYGLFSASFSSSYSFDRSRSQDYSFASKEFASQLWTLSLADIPEIELPVAEDLLAAIRSSPPNFRQSRDWYDRFFTGFGTHFIAAVGVGGRCLLCVSVLKSAVGSHEKISTQLDIEYGAFVNASGKVDYSHLDKDYRENRRHQERVFGGDVSLVGQLQGGQGKFQEWAESVKQHPGVIRFTLKGIWELFPEERRDEVAAAYADYCYRNSFYAVSLHPPPASYVDIETQDRLQSFDAATFEAWILPTGEGHNPGHEFGGIILNKERSYEIARFKNGSLQWAFKNIKPGWTWVDSGWRIPQGSWSHVAVVYDAARGEVRSYLNGNSKPGSRASIEGSISPTEAKLRLGARTEGEQNFEGYIQEVRIWNTARTTEDIQRNMYTRMTGGEACLVGLWPLNDATGNKGPDRTRPPNDGVLRHATWAEPPSRSPIQERMRSMQLAVDEEAGLVSIVDQRT